LIKKVKEARRFQETLWKQIWDVNDQKNSPVLEVLAELSASEFNLETLTVESLRGLYNRQLDNFEKVRQSALIAAGIEPKVVESLHEIYKFRSKIPTWEIKKNISNTAYLPKHYRVTQTFMGDKPAWSYYKAAGPNTNILSLDPKKEYPFRSNSVEAAANVERFRSLVGLVRAIKTGLTDQQIKHINTVLQKNKLTPDRAALVKQHIEKITEASNAHRDNDVDQLVKAAYNEFKSGSLERSYLRVALSRLNDVEVPDDLLPSLATPESINASQFLERFRSAVKIAIDRHPDYKKRLDTLSKRVEKSVNRKEVFPGQAVLLELVNTELSPVQTDDLLSIFTIRQDEGASSTLLNDVLNAHPLAAKMVGERIGEFLKDYVSYTQEYKEGAETLFADVSTDPVFENAFKRDPHFSSPTPNHPPFNSPLEEIYQWKLERLAQIFNFDLATPVGLSQFEIFTHTYDLSPGELGLDRVHSYPPAYHTY